MSGSSNSTFAPSAPLASGSVVDVYGDNANVGAAGSQALLGALVSLDDSNHSGNLNSSGVSNYFSGSTLNFNGGSLFYHANGGGSTTSIESLNIDTSAVIQAQPQGGHGTIQISSLSTVGSTSTVSFQSAWNVLGQASSNTQDVGFVTIGSLNGVSTSTPSSILTNGIIGGWATTISYQGQTGENGDSQVVAGDGVVRFATYGVNGVTAVTPDVTNTLSDSQGNGLNTPTANVQDVGVSVSPNGNVTVNSLSHAGHTGQDINLNGTLTLNSGGLALTTSFGGRGDGFWINGGSVTAGAGSVRSGSNNYNLFVTVASGSGLQFHNSAITDNGSNPVTLVKTGPGFLELGSQDNGQGEDTFTGGIVVNEGTLQIDNGRESGTWATDAEANKNTVVINAGGTLAIAATDALGYGGGGVGSITVNNYGNLHDNGNNRLTIWNNLYVNGGYVTSDANAVGNGGGTNGASTFSLYGQLYATSGADGHAATISATNFGLQNANTVFNVTRGPGAVDLLVSGIVNSWNGGNESLTLLGNGIAQFTNSNTYTGGTTIGDGSTANSPTLILGNNNALGSTGAVLTVKSGTLDLAGFSPSISGLSDSGNFGGTTPGILTSTSGNPTLAVADNNQAFGGTISGPIALTVNSGPRGYQILSGNNTYTGGTTINGELEAWSSGALGNGPVSVASGGQLGIKSTTSTSLTVGAGDQLTLANNANVALQTENGLTTGTYAGPVVLSAGAANLIATYTTPGTLAFSNTISGAGGLNVSNAALTVQLASANTFSGATTVNAGILNLSNGNAVQNSTLTPIGGNVVFDQSVTSNNFTIGGLAGSGNVALLNNASTPSAIAVSIGNNNASTSYSGILSGGGRPTKIGTGVLTLTGANTYTGLTTISGGSLVLGGSGSINNSAAIGVQGGRFVQASSTAVQPLVQLISGTLDGTGTIDTATVADNAVNVVTAGNGGSGTLTFGSLTFNGHGSFSLSNVAQVSATTLATNGAPVLVNAFNTNGVWANNTNYDLINYTNLGNSETLTQLESDVVKGTITGLSASQKARLDFTTSPGEILLDITGDNPAWSGSGNGHWINQTQNPQNWVNANNGGGTDYVDGDIAQFDDTHLAAGGTTTVDIHDGTVSPLAVTFNNSANNFTVISSGGFGIADFNPQNGTNPQPATTLTKSGTGTLTIQTANTYSGLTTINGGVLQLGNGTVGQDGSIPNSPIVDNATLAFDLAGNQTYGQTISTTGTGLITVSSGGASTLNLNGVISGNISVQVNSGTLSLGGTNTFSGGVTIAGGTLGVNGDAALGAVPSSPATNVSFTGNGTLQATAPVTLNANRSIAIGSGVNATFDSQGNTFGISGTIGGSSAAGITKIGSGTLALSGSNSYGGSTTINAGALAINGAAALPSTSNVIIAAPGTLNLGIASQTVASLADGAGGGGAVAPSISGGVALYVNPASGSTSFSGALNNGAGILSLIKTGAGTQVLAGSSGYTGGTTVTAGTLAVTNANALGTGPVSLNGGTLALSVSPLGTSAINGFGNFTVNSNNTGNPTISSDRNSLTLTTFSGSEARSAFYGTLQSVTNATGFNAQFTYQDQGGNGADGAAFVLQNNSNTALGASGGALGYGGIGNSAAYEINIYGGHTQGTNVVTGGASGVYNATGNVNVASGDPIRVTLSYIGTTLTETLLDTANNNTYTTSYTLDLNTALGGSTAYVGFTGGTGGVTSSQVVSNFSFSGGGIGHSQIVANAATTSTLEADAGSLAVGRVILNPGAVVNVTGGGGLAANTPYAMSADSLYLAGNGSSGTTLNVSNNPNGGRGVLTVAGALIDGGVAQTFTVGGPGKVVLSTGGALVAGSAIQLNGELRANNGGGNGSATGSAAISVNSGGKLGGNGVAAGAVAVNSGGVITAGPDDTTPGQLTTGGLTLASGSTFAAKIVDSTGAGTPGQSTTWDLISAPTLNITSGVTLAASGTLTNVAPGTVWNIGQVTASPALVNGSTDDGSSVTTAPNLLASNVFSLDTSHLSVNGTSNPSSEKFSLELVGNGSGDNLDLVYTATPEPGTVMLLMLGGLPLLTRRRRRV